MAASPFSILQTSAESSPQPVIIAPPKLWAPKRVYITKAAANWPLADRVAENAAKLGSEIVRLSNDRLPPILAENERRSYAEAKSTLAIVVASPSRMKLQPIPPSADWQFHLAEGCPAHCQYCYLAGSLKGAPITRLFANVPQLLGNLHDYVGNGSVTSRSKVRASEGTTFECSCYTDPLALEHLSGSLSDAVRFFGNWDAPVQLRWTTKFANVDPFLAIEHRGRTRVRFSVNADPIPRHFEGGTPPVASRLRALRKMALAGYPVGLTIAPIMPVENWQQAYSDLIQNAAAALSDVPDVDLTVELITHRFTPGSKEVLMGWYPRTPLEMDESTRAEKRTKFGSLKYVYTKDVMSRLRRHLEAAIAQDLPRARVLYWT